MNATGTAGLLACVPLVVPLATVGKGLTTNLSAALTLENGLVEAFLIAHGGVAVAVQFVASRIEVLVHGWLDGTILFGGLRIKVLAVSISVNLVIHLCWLACIGRDCRGEESEECELHI